MALDLSDFDMTVGRSGVISLRRRTGVAKRVSSSTFEFRTGTIEYRSQNQADGTRRWEQNVAFATRYSGYSTRWSWVAKSTAAALEAHVATKGA